MSSSNVEMPSASMVILQTFVLQSLVPTCGEPDTAMARWKYLLLSGRAMWMVVLHAPADPPATVTRFGSPPNLAMLSCTNLSAMRWSRIARLPLALYLSGAPGTSLMFMRPNGPRRYWMVT